MNKKTDDAKAIEDSETDQKDSPKKRQMLKTPMYAAIHSARYERQKLIRKLDEGSTILLCYVCGIDAPIERDDVMGFADLLHNVLSGDSVDLLLHTPGGDIDAAEKIVNLMRSVIGKEGTLRFIIPDFAKSAGTLMALGANRIIMSDSSELGPIDPQIWFRDGRGNDRCHSVLNYLNAYEEHALKLRDDPDDPATRLLFDKFEPWTVHKLEVMKNRARVIAENQLKRMGANFSKIAADLMDIEKWKSHNQMIGWQDAEELELPIEYLPSSDPNWQNYWQLYCLQRLAIKKNEKIFESSYVSLVVES